MSLSQLIGPCWIIRLESALISPAQFCIRAQQEQAGTDLAEVSVDGAGGYLPSHCAILSLQGRRRGDGSKAAASSSQRGVSEESGLGGAGARGLDVSGHETSPNERR